MKTIYTFLLCCISLITIAQNNNLSNGVVFDGEPFITINPNNSQHMVVAWLGFKLGNKTVIKTRTSFNAGSTWSNTTFIPHVVSTYKSADPSMSFNSNGDLFLCYIDYIEAPVSGGVYVVKSTDGGLNWGTPVEALNVNADGNKLPIDRPWMVIDKSGGINDGNIYITTKPAPWILPPNRAYFVKSTNGGANWQPWQYIDGTGWLVGNIISAPMAAPTITQNGTFHCVYPSYVFSQNVFAQYIVASTNNAGTTFNYNSALTVNQADTDTLPKKGYALISNPSDTNHLLFAYPDITNGDLDVFVIESTNGGINWTSPTRVNDDPIANNRMQDLIWADFDNDGDVVITWRDRRNASDSTYTTDSEIWGAVRWKDSTNFSPNFVITDASIAYNSVLAQNGNDFMCVNMINDTIYAVWGDTRNNFLNIWFQQIDLINGTTSVKDLANDINPITFYPNPATDHISVNFGDNEIENANYQIISILGKVITEKTIQKKETKININNYKKGNYLIKFTNKKGSKLLKFVKN